MTGLNSQLSPSDAHKEPLSPMTAVWYAIYVCVKAKSSLNDLRRKVRQDLCHFEGNAQGIRLVHYPDADESETWAPGGAVFLNTRVPHGGPEKAPATHSYLMKKPGYYLSEEAYIARLR